MNELEFSEIYERLKLEAMDKEVDVVVAVAGGGLVPGAILARILGKEIKTLWLQMYEDGPAPEKRHEVPKLLKPFEHDMKGKTVLLVDDFSRTGETLEKAKEMLLARGAAEVKTIVVAGKDALFQSDECIKLPWDKEKKNKEEANRETKKDTSDKDGV